MRRVFLDANIIFSAAWSETNGILTLWNHPELHLVTSFYALLEAERNILVKNPAAAARLARLVTKLEVSVSSAKLDGDYGLPEKDVPILEAAVAARCSVLLTVDTTHFGHLFGEVVEGVTVMTASALLRELVSD